jgi:N6-L-threonylcarbamoyladenine synthase
MMQKEGGTAYYPRLQFCTDNGAMIAYAGCQRLLAGMGEPLAFSARSRWPLDSLSALTAG